jgi:hypothetical protein
LDFLGMARFLVWFAFATPLDFLGFRWIPSAIITLTKPRTWC